eukprot:scaffold29718_cov52-Attheya_sp.AAC.4
MGFYVLGVLIILRRVRFTSSDIQKQKCMHCMLCSRLQTHLLCLTNEEILDEVIGAHPVTCTDMKGG